MGVEALSTGAAMNDIQSRIKGIGPASLGGGRNPRASLDGLPLGTKVQGLEPSRRDKTGGGRGIKHMISSRSLRMAHWRSSARMSAISALALLLASCRLSEAMLLQTRSGGFAGGTKRGQFIGFRETFPRYAGEEMQVVCADTPDKVNNGALSFSRLEDLISYTSGDCDGSTWGSSISDLSPATSVGKAEWDRERERLMGVQERVKSAPAEGGAKRSGGKGAAAAAVTEGRKKKEKHARMKVVERRGCVEDSARMNAGGCGDEESNKRVLPLRRKLNFDDFAGGEGGGDGNGESPLESCSA